MRFEIESKTYAECENFLKLAYNGEEYSLAEFSSTYKTKSFDIEKLLPECELLYRGQRKSFDDYVSERRNLAESLEFFTGYHDEVMPIEISLAISNPEYYQAAKFLEKAEACLQTARYYFLQSEDILEYDCCVNWRAGYLAIYSIRTMNFSTAIIWYNNCFDYIVQIAFLAFGLYKNIKKYSESLSFEEVLKLCTYNSLKVLHENNPDNDGLSNLWNIIETCRVARQDLNDWANYSKHKGGLGFVGLKPESPIQIFMGTPDSGYESRTSEFEAITLDIDQSAEKVISSHMALTKCLQELMTLINFPAAQCSLNNEGTFVIPDKREYRKVSLDA